MEGPSLHLLASELQIFINEKIIKCFGNAKFDKEELVNQTFKEIFAFGKKLIIQLNDYSLIIHFLMYGTYRINSERENMIPRLAIITSNQSFFIYNCSVKCLNETNLKKTLPLDLDILSKNWNLKKIVKKIQQYKTKTIDDILLDQDIFPGVGNIIKNEILFITKTKPNQKVSNLTTKKIEEIAQTAHLFSKRFLNWRKKFELKKHFKVYRKKICSLCNSQIIRKKTGKTNRWSYFCTECQN